METFTHTLTNNASKNNQKKRSKNVAITPAAPCHKIRKTKPQNTWFRLGFRIQGLGFRFEGLEFRPLAWPYVSSVHLRPFRVQGFGAVCQRPSLQTTV
jgi:hypothetical protein